jgi:hypothetical protein
MSDESPEFYKRREAQELRASTEASDPVVKRLHWEMAQRYNHLASVVEVRGEGAQEASALPAGTVSF